MSALQDYLRNCFDTGIKVNLLLKGQPPEFVEGEIESFDNEYLCIGQDKQISLDDIIGFPENEI